jgi:hypothetical protein
MQALAFDTLTLQSEEHVRRYIQYHQHAVGRLMDNVVALLSHKNTYHDFYQFYYGCLEEVLSFVEYYFANYFDQDAKVPERQAANAKKIAKEAFKKLQAALNDRDADPTLIDLVLRILKNISDKRPDHRITYRNVMYVKEVQKELWRLLESRSKIKDINESLLQVMYYLNYNSCRVLTYHVQYITSLLDVAETRFDRVEKLSLMLKKINQAQIKPGLKYHPHKPCLKDQLNNYLLEELEYHQRLQLAIKSAPEKAQEASLDGFKLKFTASVAQLAYLLKVLIETKIVVHNNLSQVLHFLVRYVVTKRSETISHGSLRSKYYVVENGTRESVRAMLMSLIQYIDKN